jgi:hypothetical protein
MSGNGLAEPFKQNAGTQHSNGAAGRACEIEMRVLKPDGKVGRVYHFTHAIADGGNQIVTQDDPSVARVAGAGMVTVSEHNERTAPGARHSGRNCRMERDQPTASGSGLR